LLIGADASQQVQAVERAVAMMRRSYREPLTLSAIASEASFSAFHFIRIFRQVTGVSPRRFLTAIRLDAAKHMLMTSRRSVTDICLAVGYSSLGTFTRRFAQSTGLSPTGLRHYAARGGQLEVAGRVAAMTARGGGPGSAVTVTGHIGPERSEEELLFAGLFPSPLPEGRPVACTVARAGGTFELGHAPTGTHWLLAVSFAPTFVGPMCLLPELHRPRVAASPVVIAARPGPAQVRVDLVLREPREIDPPILTALPAYPAVLPSRPSARSSP